MKNGDDAARKRAAFLRVLGETGNVLISAERVGVSPSWLYTRRLGDGDFARNWDAARTAARGALAAAGLVPPKRHVRNLEGRPLVVFGSPGGKGLRVSAARHNSWSARDEAMFLDCLRATCNVRGSCRVVGVRAGTAYQRRRDSVAFREAWDAAIVDGRLHVESAMIAAATNLLEGPDGDYPELVSEVVGLDAKVVLGLLSFYQRRDEGRRQRNDWRLKTITPDAARASLLAKLEAVRAAGIGREEATGDGVGDSV